ncbi:hypothetical protein SALBM311S_04566 [Streptomyces alboniger]
MSSSEVLPLRRHERFRTAEVEEARAEVGRAFCPHDLRVVGRSGRLDARMHGVSFADTGLYYLDYGAEVVITPGALEDFYLVQIPLAGSAQIACGREQIISTPQLASVPAPTEHLAMRWHEGNPQLTPAPNGCCCPASWRPSDRLPPLAPAYRSTPASSPR